MFALEKHRVANLTPNTVQLKVDIQALTAAPNPGTTLGIPLFVRVSIVNEFNLVLMSGESAISKDLWRIPVTPTVSESDLQTRSETSPIPFPANNESHFVRSLSSRAIFDAYDSAKRRVV